MCSYPRRVEIGAVSAVTFHASYATPSQCLCVTLDAWTLLWVEDLHTVSFFSSNEGGCESHPLYGPSQASGVLVRWPTFRVVLVLTPSLTSDQRSVMVVSPSNRS